MNTPPVESNPNLKPYFIGSKGTPKPSLPQFTWLEQESSTIRRTPLYEIHQKLSAKLIPFAGWEMPVWYSTVMEEHLAVRQAAGLFDVAHMGVYQAEGPDACVFLDCVCANDIGSLNVGESCYTHFLDPSANVIDDLLIYHHHAEKYLVVVNASNDDKDWTWLNAVRRGDVMVDVQQPWVHSFGKKVTLRNLRDPKEGEDMRVDLALQGPKSRDILLSLPWDDETKIKIIKLNRTQLCSAKLNGADMIISRTGYTGEKIAFELFIHPERLAEFWNLLMEHGQAYGLKPCGLGARDSLRTEAGLPLYGHEMGGEKNLGVAEAGFGAYIKTYKPWFIGRGNYLKREKERKAMVARFRFVNQHVRMAHPGDEVLDENGQVIGFVTSCAIDSQGYLTGQAFLPISYHKENQKIFVYQQAKKQADQRRNTNPKDQRTSLPDEAIVISRFLK
jgi:glycine hydroxymethyltransferase